MAIRLKCGAIFLHVPKTGGNWVTAMLERCGLVDGPVSFKHADIDRTLYPLNSGVRFMLGHWLDRKRGRIGGEMPFLFCFVRHPLSWYESYFKYMNQPSRAWRNWGRPGSLHTWHPHLALNGTASSDFNQFVRNVLRARPGYVTEMYGWYARQETGFVGRQENLVDDLVSVLRGLDLDFDESIIRESPPLGVSPAPQSPLTWDPALRREVLTAEYAGLLRYGYTTPGATDARIDAARLPPARAAARQ